MTENDNNSPPILAKRRGRGGIEPPPERQFGQPDGNPRNNFGRPPAGLSLIEYFNLMAQWPQADLERVADDEGQPAARRTSAMVWLRALSTATTKAGTPIAGAEIDRLFDRTIGKSLQRLAVDQRVLTVRADATAVSILPNVIGNADLEDQADLIVLLERIDAKARQRQSNELVSPASPALLSQSQQPETPAGDSNG